MNSLILSVLFILGKNIFFCCCYKSYNNINLALISITNGINCVSCVGWSNTGCNDPYDESTSGDLPVPGNTYCLVSHVLYRLFFKLNFILFFIIN
jgi:hypothetical protein